MQKNKKEILDRFVKEVADIYGSNLRKIVLYGSYARGDYRDDSDIDIMILVDLSELDAKDYQDSLFGITYDYNLDYDMDINPIVHSEDTFRKWVNVYPFFKNVQKDGIVLYEQKYE